MWCPRAAAHPQKGRRGRFSQAEGAGAFHAQGQCLPVNQRRQPKAARVSRFPVLKRVAEFFKKMERSVKCCQFADGAHRRVAAGPIVPQKVIF